MLDAGFILNSCNVMNDAAAFAGISVIFEAEEQQELSPVSDSSQQLSNEFAVLSTRTTPASTVSAASAAVVTPVQQTNVSSPALRSQIVVHQQSTQSSSSVLPPPAVASSMAFSSQQHVAGCCFLWSQSVLNSLETCSCLKFEPPGAV